MTQTTARLLSARREALLPCNGNFYFCKAGEVRDGYWVHLRYYFVDVFVPDVLIDLAISRHSSASNRERVAMNIAIGIRAGVYER